MDIPWKNLMCNTQHLHRNAQSCIRTKNVSGVYDLQLGLWCEDTQTKRTYHLPWCSGDVYALTWGVAMPQAMIWAKVADRHGVLVTKTGPATRDYLFIGQNRGQYFIHRLGVKGYLSFSCAISHHTEFAHMYVRRQYHRYVRSPTMQELQEPNHRRGDISLTKRILL